MDEADAVKHSADGHRRRNWVAQMRVFATNGAGAQ